MRALGESRLPSPGRSPLAGRSHGAELSVMAAMFGR